MDLVMLLPVLKALLEGMFSLIKGFGQISVKYWFW